MVSDDHPPVMKSGAPVDRKRRLLHLVALSAVVLAPALFWIAYLPINSAWTVEQFGCGCHSGFNANSFNTILGVVVCAASLGFLVFMSAGLTGIRKYLYLILGGVFQVITTIAGLILNEWR